MFELLAPVFAVAGGLIAGLPVILHMFRRSPAIRLPFSVVRFLTPTLPKTTKRSRIEHWPLMLLRILAVILIALAFGRPFQRSTVAKAAESGSSDRIAVLIDASASMRRDGIREAVLAELQKIYTGLNDNDSLSVAVFSETTRTLISADEWRQTEHGSRAALIERASKNYEPDWLSTKTAKAMLEAADEVGRETGTAESVDEKKVVLITDFQEGSQLDELQSGSWPDSVKLDLRVVQPTQPGNAGLSLVEDERSGRVRVRVTNSGDAVTTKHSLSLFSANGQLVGTPITVDVGGGQRRTVTMPDMADDQPLAAGVELLNEPHVFDNVVDLPIEERGVIQVGHAGNADANNADSMRYYLQRALDGNETDPVELIDLLSVDGLAVPVPESARLVIVTELIPEGLVRSLVEFVDRGGMVLLALKSAEMASAVSQLLPENTGIEEASIKDYAMLGQIDFSGSLLSPFADARFADFSSIKFWHHRKLSLDEKAAATRIVARFDSGTPAILEVTRPSGGKVVILSAGWHPEDSQWALSTRFPPMIHRLIQIANPRQSGHQLLEAGHRVNPSELSGQKQWSLTDPNGKIHTLPDVKILSETDVPKEEPVPNVLTPETVLLDSPGRWTLSWDSIEGAKSMSLLVTVAASESRTEPLPAGQLQALGMSSDIATVKSTSAGSPDPDRTAQLDASELESKQKFWRWLLLAGLGCLLLESILASIIEKTQRMELV